MNKKSVARYEGPDTIFSFNRKVEEEWAGSGLSDVSGVKQSFSLRICWIIPFHAEYEPGTRLSMYPPI